MSYLLLLLVVGIVTRAFPTPFQSVNKLGPDQAQTHAFKRSHDPARGSDALLKKNDSIPSRACGTEPPTPELLQLHKQLSSRRERKRASPFASLYTVDMYFHIVSTKDQANSVTKDMIANQAGVLQAAYASSNLSFVLIGVDHTINDTWATDANDADMKLALRKGNYSTLNVYFQTNLSTTAYGAPTQLLGYCTLPTNVTYSPCDSCGATEFPPANYALDGCNVHAGSMPNGVLDYYNQGKTAIHEVGHWLGLLHTFQDNSCDPTDPGDYIDDTPQESVSTDGCPSGKHSCPGLSGVDPIHNYMDYSTDACYEAFTPEQILRMQDMYKTLRYRF